MPDLAKVAYDAYVKAVGGVSLVSGEPLPEFDQLPENIRQAWDASSQAVARAVNP